MSRKSLVVAEGGGEDAGAVLDQEADHGQVVTAGGAVKGRPPVRVLRGNSKGLENDP